MLRAVLLVGLGGFLGSAARFLCTYALGVWTVAGFAFGTLAVNAVGSFLIGIFMAVLKPGGLYYLCAVGFCGGFTTFSTFSAETLGFIRAGHLAAAFGYISASVALCILLTWTGTIIGHRL